MIVLVVLAFVLALLGMLLTAMNFYLSFVRYPVHRLFHRGEPYRWASGIALFGSMFLWIAALMFWWTGHSKWVTGAVLLSLFDTGGIHWFLIWQGYWAIRRPEPPNVSR